MAGVDLLRKLREAGGTAPVPDKNAGRVIPLLPEEVTQLGAQDGSPVVVEVSGTLSGDSIQVDSVRPKGPSAPADPTQDMQTVRLATELKPG